MAPAGACDPAYAQIGPGGLVDRGVHALHLTWMAQRTKAGQARPLMRAILDHVVRAGAPLAPAHARCTALAYKLLDAQ